MDSEAGRVELLGVVDGDICKDGSSRRARSIAKTRHGHAKGSGNSPTYQSWQSMLARCRYPERDTEKKHAGRGIIVCDRWHLFDAFLEDMGVRPDGCTIDRFPNQNGNYEPANCRWATPTEQARNRRNGKLTFETAVQVALARLAGEPCKALAERFGISESLPREIVKGRTWKDALTEANIRREKAHG